MTIAKLQSSTLAVRTQVQGVPTLPGDGTDLTPFGSASWFPKRFLVEITVTGAGTAHLGLYALSSAGAWCRPVDPNGNQGAVAGDQALGVGVYAVIFEDVALFSRICLVQSQNAGGTPVVAATLFGIADREDSQ